MATFHGTFVNPTESFCVRENPDGDGWIVAVALTPADILSALLDGEIDESEARLQRERGWRPHTTARIFAESEDADEWIEGLHESFERDYDDYLEENSHEIAQMERYEQWRNEY